jgi:CRP-like cAMP-binding protein
MLAHTDESALLKNLFHTGKRLIYEKGDLIIRPGEDPPGVFYIEHGLVKSYDITKYGDENLLIIRKNGELLGLTYAITQESRGVIYCALTPTIAWLITHDNFIAFLHRSPNAALPVLDMITRMYRIHGDRIMTLEYRTVRERLASFLLTMVQRFGHTNHNGSVSIEAPLKQTDIASSINASRETASRAITDLETKGIISHTQCFITVHDIATLKNVLK